MSSFSRVLKRQAGATPKELFVIAALIGFSVVFSAYGVVSFGVDIAGSF